MPDISVAVKANFDNQLALLGYDLPLRRADSGGSLPLTLYWQAMSQMDATYVVFNHLLDRQQNNWGGYDRWPLETANTVLWHPGEIVTDTFNLPVKGDAPPGIYTVDIGLYDQADPGSTPLPLMNNGRRLDQNSVRIGPVKIGGPPPGITVKSVLPEIELHTRLGDKVELVGFDQIRPMGKQSDDVELTLYWRPLTRLETDYTVFVHLRNEDDETIAQKDGPPAGGLYPSSLWEPGEIIRDEISLVREKPLAPGRYKLVTGLYDFVTGERLPVSETPQTEILLIRFEIGS
jgi:hypothetical protein